MSCVLRKRYCLPHARVMIHQGSGYIGQETPSDIEIAARNILFYRTQLNQILARHSGQPIETVHRDTDRDYWMSAEEARAYGIVDRVMTRADRVITPAGQLDSVCRTGVLSTDDTIEH